MKSSIVCIYRSTNFSTRFEENPGWKDHVCSKVDGFINLETLNFLGKAVNMCQGTYVVFDSIINDAIKIL